MPNFLFPNERSLQEHFALYLESKGYGVELEVDIPGVGRIDILAQKIDASGNRTQLVIECKDVFDSSKVASARRQVQDYGHHYPDARLIILGQSAASKGLGERAQESADTAIAATIAQGVEVYFSDTLEDFQDWLSDHLPVQPEPEPEPEPQFTPNYQRPSYPSSSGLGALVPALVGGFFLIIGAAAIMASGSSKYQVQAGDTASSIARRSGMSVEEFRRRNPQIKNPNDIQAGEKVNIPKPTQPPSSKPQTPASKPKQQPAIARNPQQQTIRIPADRKAQGINAVNCRARPTVQAPVVTAITEGTAVSVLRLEAGWALLGNCWVVDSTVR